MLTEHKFRQQLVAVWRSVGTPIRRARSFLKLSQRAQALGKRLMDLGFVNHREGDHEKSRRFWSSAASMFTLSATARRHAKSALNGKDPAPSFETAPTGLAVPPWEREGEMKPPRDDSAEHVGLHG